MNKLKTEILRFPLFYFMLPFYAVQLLIAFLWPEGRAFPVMTLITATAYLILCGIFKNNFTKADRILLTLIVCDAISPLYWNSKAVYIFSSAVILISAIGVLIYNRETSSAA